MDGQFAGHGVRFRFPSFWEIDEERTDGGTTITANSPETSFWSLSLYPDRPDPILLMKQAVDAFRDEYDELDAYPAEARLCNSATSAVDLEFVCLELINAAFLRSFRTERFTALVLYQGTDHELAETRPILEAVSDSLNCEAHESLAVDEGRTPPHYRL